jgi:rhamnose transport system substrate-binding protein
LKHRAIGRLVVLTSVAAVVFAACSSTGGSAAPSTAASAAPSAAGPITVGYLPKDIVNQYFAAAKTGVDKAAGETGGTVIQVGPNEAKADLQIPFITDLTTQ